MRIHELKAAEGRPATIVDGAARIHDVVREMSDTDCGAVIVRDDGSTLDAILTEGDVIQGIARHGVDALQMTAASLATTATLGCALDDYVTEVAILMTQRDLSHLPVRKDGRIVEIVSQGEILRQRIADRRRATRAIVAAMARLGVPA